MGFRIDRFALTVLLAGALYIFFMGATGNIPVAAAAAFLAMAILKKLSEKIPTDRIGRKRRTQAQAQTELEELSLSDRRTAETRIRDVLRHAYGNLLDGITLRIILRHPAAGSITGDDVCRILRKPAACKKILIVSTAKADNTARSLTKRLQSPRAELIDGMQLARLLADCGPAPRGILARPARSTSRLTAAARAASRANPAKCAVTAVMMFMLFWFGGKTVYLVGALLLSFITFASLRKRHVPRELFI